MPGLLAIVIITLTPLALDVHPGTLHTHGPKDNSVCWPSRHYNSHFADERESPLYRWEGNLQFEDEETNTQRSQATYLSKVPQQQVLCEAEARLQGSSLLVWALFLWCFSSMWAGWLVDFWADVLWLNGPWAWLSQGLGAAGDVLLGQAVAYGRECHQRSGHVGVYRSREVGIVVRQLIPHCPSYLGDGGMKRIQMAPGLGMNSSPSLHPGLGGRIPPSSADYLPLVIWSSLQRQNAPSFQLSLLLPLPPWMNLPVGPTSSPNPCLPVCLRFWALEDRAQAE